MASCRYKHDESIGRVCLFGDLGHLNLRVLCILDVGFWARHHIDTSAHSHRGRNVQLFVMVGMHGGHNAPFFMTRFRESVKHYSAIYEGLDISMPRDDPDRVIVEREIFGSQILNIVACEGQARVERAEPYRQWQNRFQRAGFTQLPILDTVFNKMKAMMGAFHKDYGVGRDDGWFLMGIRNQIVKFCSAWEPKCP